jgi:hypothetical protein
MSQSTFKEKNVNANDAAYQTAHDPTHGGTDALAVRMGTTGAMLRNKVNPHNTTHHLRLDEASRLMTLTNDHSILEALAHEHGYVCIKLPESFDPSDLCLIEQTLKVGVSKGELSAETLSSLADGRICEGDVKRVKKRAQQLLKEIVTLVDLIKRLSK